MKHNHHPSSSLFRSFFLHLLPGLVFVFFPATIFLAGCGGSNADAAAAQPQYMRTPHPTFTPTPQTELPPSQPVVINGEPKVESDNAGPPQAITPTPTAPPAAQPVIAGQPIAVINTDLVNARTGPGTEFTIVTILGRGEQFDITGKDASGQWWRVCCVEGEDAWVVGEFVDTDGAVDNAPVLDANSPPSAQSLERETAPAAAEPAAPAATQAPLAAAATDTPPPPTNTVEPAPDSSGFEFNLIAKEQFPETNVVRVFLFVYSGGDGLEGYSLRVSKDGAELPVSGESFGGRPGFTWPIADPRQRSQNFKVEFPGQSPAGVWDVQLVKAGAPVGPPVQFTLGANDPNRELYVRYERP